MKEKVILNQKEQKRLIVLNQVRERKLVGREAAMTLNLSLRQVRRLLTGYRQYGAQALAHGNRGRKPRPALDDGLRQSVLELAKTKYDRCNTQHFTELLAEREGIVLSRSTVRRLLRSDGITSPRKRRAPRHRRRRERYEQEGQLLQIDGSRHDWLEGRWSWLTLVGAIDDATGKVPYALFRDREDSQGYFLLLQGIVAQKGIPLALYHDRHSIFEHTMGVTSSLDEQLEGRRRPTQYGRLMEELGITSISAHSPQAKGRVERLWGTFQDRLTSEMRLAGVSSLDAANQVLWDFLPRFNARFAVPPALPGTAYIKPGPEFDPDTVFCFKYERKVGVDNVVRFGEYRLQIMQDECRVSYARAKVVVQERMDGSLAVYHQGRCLAHKPATQEAPVLRSRRNEKVALADRKPDPTSSNASPEPVGTISHPDVTKPKLPHPWRTWVHHA
jgi:transposase